MCEGKNQALYINSTDMKTHTHTHTHTQSLTFAALCSVVGIPSWAIATFRGSRVVGACALAVTAAVVIQAWVRGGGSGGKIFQSLCVRIFDSLRFLTPCAEVAAPPVGVVRDALACCYIHA